MKVALFSDLHAHPFHQYARVLPNGRNSRLQDALDAIAAVRRSAGEHGARAVAFGGDLFHTMGRLDVGTLNGVFAEIAAFSAAHLPVFLLVGNHDQADKTGRHALEVFKVLEHVVVMDEPGWYVHPAAPGLAVYAIPYRDDTNAVRELLAAIPPGPSGANHRLLILHAGFDGAKTGPHEYRMASELAAGDAPDGFDLVLSGHYHLPQWIDEHRRIAYIGAATHQTWGDANQPRGHAIADLAMRSLERFESLAPRFLRLAPSEIERARPGDFVEVLLPHDADDAMAEAAQHALEASGAGGGQVVRAPRPERGATARLGCGHTTDVGALIAPYVEHVSEVESSRADLVALGHDLLRKAAA